MVTLPEDYEQRLMEMAGGQFKKLKLLVPDPYDLILSKLQRGSQKDFAAAAYLFNTQSLSLGHLSGTMEH